MNQPRTRRIPAPLYAAAGAGELAYASLRRLPALVTGLTGRAASLTGQAASLPERVAATRADLRDKAVASLRSANSTAQALRERSNRALRERPRVEFDVDRMREAAIRNAAIALTNAQAAQERAAAAYAALVARGERVIGTGVVHAADTVNADMAATEVAELGATPATVAEVTEATTEATPAGTTPAGTTPAGTTPAGITAAEPAGDGETSEAASSKPRRTSRTTASAGGRATRLAAKRTRPAARRPRPDAE